MRLTRFFHLKEAVRQLHAREGVDGLAFRLTEEPFRIDPAELVFGVAGIYLLTTDGAVTRVLLYDSEQSVNSTDMDPLLRADVLRGGFDSAGLLQHLPRYHLVHCETLQKQSAGGWQENAAWQISQRPANRFIFSYTTKTGVLCDMDAQKLLPCESCLQQMNELGVADRTVENSDNLAALLNDGEFYTRWRKTRPAECSDTPRHLYPDWRKISDRYKQLRNRQCEGKNCSVTVARAELVPDIIETHYTQPDKQKSQFHYLRNLCLHCHAKQLGHGRLRQRHDYLQMQEDLQLNKV